MSPSAPSPPPAPSGAAVRPSPAPDVLVVGGGLVGLFCADALERRGARVELWERGGSFGAESGAASHASAGMLAPLAEVPDDPDFLAVCLRARDLWRDAARQLADRSGIDLDYDDDGALLVDHVDAPATAFEAAALLAGEPILRLDDREARDLVPDLAPDAGPFLFLPGEHRVDNRRVLEALAKLIPRPGVRVRFRCALERLTPGPTGVRAESAEHSTEAGAVLIAAGAWSSRVRGLATPPIHPVKGQMMRFSHVDWPLGGCVRSGHFYTARRRGGEVLLGATVEPEAGFDARVTGGGLESLTGFARSVLPGLLNRPVVETWAGLRPGSPDGRPHLGPLDDRVWVASGHSRNGVLLAPWTANTVADWLLDGAVPDEPGVRLFAPERSLLVEP
ncbi:MAG: FAD-dependent oxidoreductase [Acidobacteriota bacterium]